MMRPMNDSSTPPVAPRFDDILHAARRIEGMVLHTPLLRSQLPDIDAWLKPEYLQASGAFKLRGASHALARLDEGQRRRGVACCSTGNHGRAVAYAARMLGIPATVCLSSLVPQNKVSAVQALGARVCRVGNSQDEAQQEVARLVAEEGLTDIPPFDHADVIAGQGTIGLEILLDAPHTDCIVVPLSGGGLAAGVALAAKTLKPSLRIVGISMTRGAAMAASLRAGRPVEVAEVETLADSLGGGIGLHNRHTFALCQHYLDEVIEIDENAIYAGMQSLYRVERIIAEGAAAVAHGAIASGQLRPRGHTVFLVTGANVDMDRYTRIIAGEALEIGGEVVGGGIHA